MQHWLEQLLQARYGPRREGLNENQLFLFAAARLSAGQETPPDPELPTAGPAEETRRAPPKGHGRQPPPQSLQRQRMVHDLKEEERHCPQCQEELKRTRGRGQPTARIWGKGVRYVFWVGLGSARCFPIRIAPPHSLPIPSSHTAGFVGWHSGCCRSLPWVPRRSVTANSFAAREPATD
jgi:hypothetical protein